MKNKDKRVVVRKKIDVYDDTFDHFRRAVAWAQRNGEIDLTLKAAIESALRAAISKVERKYGAAPDGAVSLRPGPRINV